jgi:hypothetical protein
LPIPRLVPFFPFSLLSFFPFSPFPFSLHCHGGLSCPQSSRASGPNGVSALPSTAFGHVGDLI